MSEIISSGLATSGDTLAILAILAEEGLPTGVLSGPFALFGGGITETGITFGTVRANIELDSSDSHLLDQSLMKVQENEQATLNIGGRYPIETSSYTGSYYTSAGKVASSTTPEVQYQDIGFSPKVTPRAEGGPPHSPRYRHEGASAEGLIAQRDSRIGVIKIALRMEPDTAGQNIMNWFVETVE